MSFITRTVSNWRPWHTGGNPSLTTSYWSYNLWTYPAKHHFCYQDESFPSVLVVSHCLSHFQIMVLEMLAAPDHFLPVVHWSYPLPKWWFSKFWLPWTISYPQHLRLCSSKYRLSPSDGFQNVGRPKPFLTRNTQLNSLPKWWFSKCWPPQTIPYSQHFRSSYSRVIWCNCRKEWRWNPCF